jgi:hypothetical protein
MCTYGFVMLLLLTLLASALKNFPAGLCAGGLLLSLTLVLFCVLPLLYTVSMLGLRDGCANVELVVTDALTSGRFAQLPDSFPSLGSDDEGGAAVAAGNSSNPGMSGSRG